MGKKTLYLDLDSLDRLKASLNRLPGRPSVSSFLSEQFPMMADNLDRMVSLMTTPAITMEALNQGLNVVADEQLELIVALKKMIRDVPPKESVVDVPASKPKRQKKLA